MSLENASRTGWIAAALAIVLLYWRQEFFGNGPGTIAIQVASAALWIWARLTFGRRSFHGSASPTAGQLVTTGPYRFIRHPIYASLIYFTAAGVMAHASAVSIACLVVVAGGLLTRVWAEERLLRAQYPGYADYAARTKRVMPFVI